MAKRKYIFCSLAKEADLSSTLNKWQQATALCECVNFGNTTKPHTLHSQKSAARLSARRNIMVCHQQANNKLSTSPKCDTFPLYIVCIIIFRFSFAYLSEMRFFSFFRSLSILFIRAKSVGWFVSHLQEGLIQKIRSHGHSYDEKLLLTRLLNWLSSFDSISTIETYILFRAFLPNTRFTTDSIVLFLFLSISFQHSHSHEISLWCKILGIWTVFKSKAFAELWLHCGKKSMGNLRQMWNKAATHYFFWYKQIQRTNSTCI